MKLAYFSPLNPVHSGISDYSEELLQHLGRLAEVDLFVDAYQPTNAAVTQHFRVDAAADYDRLRRERRYDVPLYQMGNHVCHAFAYRSLRRYPGITVLHDYFLHHLVVAMTAAEGDENAYVREMGYSHGRPGIEAARRALATNHQFPYDAFPVNRRVVDLSFGVIVHSDYVRQLLEQAFPGKLVATIPHLAFAPRALSPSRCTRSRLNLDGCLVFGAFGQITTAKRLETALGAFRRVHDSFPSARFLIVGDGPARHEADEVVASLGLAEVVWRERYLPLDDLLACMRLTDVGINLRWPILGETSGSLVRLLGAGKPTIVTDAGPFAEFPDSCCVKITADADEEDRLAEAMLRLARDAELRRTMGEAARDYVQQHHSAERAAQLYVNFIDTILKGRRPPT